ncbi:MAG: winged helix DNA-binding domain-containing protein [Planctomycetes bacterium]|nr:winged helix DNA-binding domain-containing protein [Planctomycetota bacterium]
MRLDDLRALAVTRSLAPCPDLPAALERAGFVQADPIRAPACAQDLILRHRVAGYRVGDLERAYPGLEVEEGYLYAYGFLSRPLWRLAHPARTAGMTALERRVLDTVRSLGQVHPRDLEAHHGRARRTNAWGGRSKATTMALERLHGRGLLRVVRRESGVRVYAAVTPAEPPVPPQAARDLVRAVASVMAPAPERLVRAFASRLRRRAPRAPAPLRALLEAGELARVVVDGVAYLLPRDAAPADPPRTARLLAPFDPVVWDRARFEHLWGWAYRFEAYTPVARRVRGYYALPLLWRDRVIGWGNARVEGGGLVVDVGFERAAPKERGFRAELAAELERLRKFLGASRARVAR